MIEDAVRVVKMSGAGNDFLVLGPDEARRLGPDLVAWVRRVCRRGLSVGADGVLIVEPAGTDRVRVKFHNPDGSVAFCGNGSRCAARFARLRGMAAASMVLETGAGEVAAEVTGERVRLRLAGPEDRGMLRLEHNGERVEGRRIEAGVPHFVILVASVREAPLERWGPAFRRHVRFGPGGTNVDVVERLADDALALRTWERGVEGETLACGSAAVAAAAAARLEGAGVHLRVIPKSGVTLDVSLPGPPGAAEAAVLSGDARLLFDGLVGAEATCFGDDGGADDG